MELLAPLAVVAYFIFVVQVFAMATRVRSRLWRAVLLLLNWVVPVGLSVWVVVSLYREPAEPPLGALILAGFCAGMLIIAGGIHQRFLNHQSRS